MNVLALTDHDTMEGVPAASKIARRLGIRLIPGVEISAKFATRLVSDTRHHVLDHYHFPQEDGIQFFDEEHFWL